MRLGEGEARATGGGRTTEPLHPACSNCSFVSVMCRDYTPSYFFEELRGLSDASGVDYNLLLRVHMLPELIKVPHATPPLPVHHQPQSSTCGHSISTM